MIPDVLTELDELLVLLDESDPGPPASVFTAVDSADRRRRPRYEVWGQWPTPPYNEAKPLAACWALSGRYQAAWTADDLHDAGYVGVRVIDTWTGSTILRRGVAA